MCVFVGVCLCVSVCLSERSTYRHVATQTLENVGAVDARVERVAAVGQKVGGAQEDGVVIVDAVGIRPGGLGGVGVVAPALHEAHAGEKRNRQREYFTRQAEPDEQ